MQGLQQMPDGERFEAETLFNCPADTIWQMLADLDNPDLANGFARLLVDGDAVGAIRTLWLDPSGENVVSEIIEELDAATRTLAYRLLTFGAVPFTRYAGRLFVTPRAEESCTLRYEARFVARDHVSPMEAKAIAAGSFSHLCANISASLKRMANAEHGAARTSTVSRSFGISSPR